ncbi:hypothetical protein ED5_3111 [Enterobacter roggenkampii]|uniref:hypothetical protein n=1 Tax=Enterobacter roggenkampii TaxID=1812935 RepID=UPI0015A5BC24|nr:hypothetical protein [Enterobacter roggenkampii]QLC83752.1 hypothetical protein ED5_3111 [Enterobacter roggenkampii]HEO9338323.1 hypothetical protein [Enterobacter roggenkampii]
MILSEMLSLDNWLKEKEKKYHLIDHLNALEEVLRENTQVRSVNNRNFSLKSFNEEKNNVIDALSHYRLSELTKDQLSCLSINDADQLLGETASKDFKEMFRDEMHDLAFLKEQVTKHKGAIITTFESIHDAAEKLKPYATVIENSHYLENTSRLSIVFKDGVKIDTLKDMESRAKEWSQIIHNLGSAVGVAPNEFKILGTRNGSIIIDLYLCSAAIIPIGFILNRTLSIIERFAISMKRIKSIYSYDPNDPAYKEIEKEITKLNEKYFNVEKLLSAQKIADEVVKEMELPEGKVHEAHTQIQSSIKKILEHLKKGGELDAYVPKENKDDDLDDKNAKRAYKVIEEFRHKKLGISKEEMIALLEHINFDE